MARKRTHPSSGPQAAAGTQSHRPPEDAHERLRALRERWHDLEAQYEEARSRNAQQHMSNLRGLMLIIKREIGRLGGDLPAFPYSTAQRRKSA